MIESLFDQRKRRMTQQMLVMNVGTSGSGAQVLERDKSSTMDVYNYGKHYLLNKEMIVDLFLVLFLLLEN